MLDDKSCQILVLVALFFAVLFVLFNCSKDCPKKDAPAPVTGTRPKAYDIFLAIGLLYMLLGNDLTNPLFSKMAIGERTSPTGNIAQKFLYNIHAENDPMMRSTKPVYGREDMLPPFLTNMSYSYLILASPIEIVFIYKLFGNDTGSLPDCLQVASSAFIFRSITEIMYGGTLQFNKVAPFKGKAMTRYLIEAVPQMIIPFLIAERFYGGTYEYTFNPARFALFLTAPLILLALNMWIYSK